ERRQRLRQQPLGRQALARHPLQVARGLRLHPRRDLFGGQFQQELRHQSPFLLDGGRAGDGGVAAEMRRVPEKAPAPTCAASPNLEFSPPPNPPPSRRRASLIFSRQPWTSWDTWRSVKRSTR